MDTHSASTAALPCLTVPNLTNRQPGKRLPHQQTARQKQAERKSRATSTERKRHKYLTRQTDRQTEKHKYLTSPYVTNRHPYLYR